MTTNHTDEEIATIENWFTYHPPFGDQAMRYESLREDAKALAYAIMALCPEGHERDQAFMLLRESLMCANAAIACGEVKAAINDE